MTQAIDRTAGTQQEAHELILAGNALAKRAVASGRRVRVLVEEVDPDMRLRQLAFYRGPLLKQVSEQARSEGQRYARPVWHELFREQFLGSRFILVNDQPVEVPVSTGELGIQRLSEYIDQVLAEAVTVWGVRFVFDIDQREAVRWKPAAAEVSR